MKAKDVVTIYQAKTHLSKLVKQAAAGQTIYIGAYGQPQVILRGLTPEERLQLYNSQHSLRLKVQKSS